MDFYRVPSVFPKVSCAFLMIFYPLGLTKTPFGDYLLCFF